MYVLGISCFYHDSAACLLKDGKIVAAAQEERFTRKKHEDSFPHQSIEYCFSVAGITIQDVNFVGFYEKPFLKFERILEGYLNTFPKSYRAFMLSMRVWLKEKFWIKEKIKKELNYHGKIYFIEHHLAHMASSFLVSPFNNSAIMTVDAVGEWATTSLGTASGNDIKVLKEIHWPNSLGMLYSAITYYLGFKVNDAEYKVMGAAPYGKPVYADIIKKEIIDIKDDGSFKLNMKYFKYHYGLVMTGKRIEELFGHPRRESESKMEQFHWDMAASIQDVTNEIVVKMANYLYKQTGFENICLSGGVALNCVANSKILSETPFKNVFINPAAGDAGSAMGVAVYIDNVILKNGRRTKLESVYLGPEFSDQEIQEYLDAQNVKYVKLSDEELLKTTASLIADQKVVGWFQGKMEWGPRALGNRSIIADARNKENWKRVNLKVKFRESFRPFAPSVLEEKSGEYFELSNYLLSGETPASYMLLVVDVKSKDIPSVTHVNNTARLQTVSKKQNELYYGLIKEFENLTGCPVIINTSFNVRSEPIVCTPQDAFACFRKTEMDCLVMNNYLIKKTYV